MRKILIPVVLLIFAVMATSIFADNPCNFESQQDVQDFVLDCISEWSGVSVDSSDFNTFLDGLGGKAWPEDYTSLVSLMDVCMPGLDTLPADTFATWETIEDPFTWTWDWEREVGDWD